MPTTRAVIAWVLALVPAPPCASGSRVVISGLHAGEAGGGGALLAPPAPRPARRSEAVRELAHARDDEALAVDTLDDAEDVDDEDDDPEDRLQRTGATAEVDRRRRHREHGQDDDGRDLGHEEHQAMLGVPLHLAVFLLDEQGD